MEDIGIWIWNHPSSKSLHARIFFQHKDLETKTIFRYVHLFKHSLVPQEIFKWRKFLQIFWPYYGPKKSTCMLHKVHSPLAYYNFVKYDIKSMKFTKIPVSFETLFSPSQTYPIVKLLYGNNLKLLFSPFSESSSTQ